MTECYNCAENLPVSDQVDDRLRDILEPLLSIAAIADAESGCGRNTDALAIASHELVALRAEHDDDRGTLVAALVALANVCLPDDRDVAISADDALRLFRATDSLAWINSQDMARRLLRRLGFNSAIHRRARFIEVGRSVSRNETARGYQFNLGRVRDLLSRYS